jgi:hypothetical protein
MLSNWSQPKLWEVTFGTAKANGFEARLDLSLFAQVIAVGYSFDQAGNGVCEGLQGFLSVSFLALAGHM